MRKPIATVLTLALLLLAGMPAFAAQETDAKPVAKKGELPEGFVYLDEAVPGIAYDIRYYGEYNFVGARVDGYKAPVAIASAKAAAALKAVQAELKPKGYGLLVLDAYRPQKAVHHFKRWAQDAKDTKMKKEFYPKLDKKNLFKLGFIASKSAHSRGSAVDLTLISLKTGKPVDMGGSFDFFGDVSHHGTKRITAKQTANRNILKNAMSKHGFVPYGKEWWHYSLKTEPFPKTYFDFDIE